MILRIGQQLVSIELAERMKKLGFTQDTFFFYDSDTNILHRYGEAFQELMNKGELTSAYSVAELGGMLPIVYGSYKHENGFAADRLTWEQESEECQYADTEADARAKLLIYLAEHSIINPKELG